jgi:hypothetical protein
MFSNPLQNRIRIGEEFPRSIAEGAHPQIQSLSIIDAENLEEDYIRNAHDHYELRGYCKPRDENTINCYKRLHEKLKEVGLLNDLNLDATPSADYVRLCLARAAQYLKEYEPSKENHSVVAIDELPLGPLSAVQFKNYFMLERAADNAHFEKHCIVCSTVIKRGESVLFTCQCCATHCRGCVILSTAAQFSTYRTRPFGISCSVCRKPSYFIVTNVEDSIFEENALISRAYRRLYPKGRSVKAMLYERKCPHSPSTLKNLDIFHFMLASEAIEHGLHRAQVDEAEEEKTLYSSQHVYNFVLSENARLQVLFVTTLIILHHIIVCHMTSSYMIIHDVIHVMTSVIPPRF